MKNKTLFVFGDSFCTAPPRESNLGVGWSEQIELSDQSWAKQLENLI